MRSWCVYSCQQCSSHLCFDNQVTISNYYIYLIKSNKNPCLGDGHTKPESRDHALKSQNNLKIWHHQHDLFWMVNSWITQIFLVKKYGWSLSVICVGNSWLIFSFFSQDSRKMSSMSHRHGYWLLTWLMRRIPTSIEFRKAKRCYLTKYLGNNFEKIKWELEHLCHVILNQVIILDILRKNISLVFAIINEELWTDAKKQRLDLERIKVVQFCIPKR